MNHVTPTTSILPKKRRTIIAYQLTKTNAQLKKTIHFVFGLFFLTMLAGHVQAQGGLDPSFNPIDHGIKSVEGANHDVYAIVVQPDGKILIGGMFTSFNGKPVNRIARINADGSLDAGFNNGGTGADGFISKIALQTDGKIIIAGNFTKYNGVTANFILRLNVDGSRDAGFNSGSGLNGSVSKLLIQPDGKIIIGGNFTNYNGNPSKFILRLNSGGDKDAGFDGSSINSPVKDIGIQADGKYIVGMFSGKFLVRLLVNGTNDPSFQSPTVITSVIVLAVQTDDKIIISLDYKGTVGTRFLRLEGNGSVDPDFDSAQNGVVPVASSIVLQPNGKILIGNAHNVGLLPAPVSRLNTDGSPDPSFQYEYLRDIDETIFTIALQADGKILTGESLQSVFNNNEKYPRVDFYLAAKDFRINRYNADGTKDHDFCINPQQTGANRNVYAIAHQADGKILIGGSFFSYNGTSANYITRLLEDGSRDMSFNIGSGPDSRVNAIAVQPDGKILVGGLFKFYNGEAVNQLVRLNADGSRDNSFNYTTPMGIGRVTKILLQPDGQILVSWFVGSTTLAVQRLNPDGSRDLGFNANIPASYLQSYVFINSIALQPDGKILVGGSYGSGPSGSTSNQNITRLEANGSRDLTFNPTVPQRRVGTTSDVNDIAVLPNGKIILVGSFIGYDYSVFTTIALNIIRLNANGTPDLSFNVGANNTFGGINAISVQPDGKMILAGSLKIYNTVSVNNLIRIQEDGALDTTFNAGELSANESVFIISPQPNGQKFVIGGAFTAYNGEGKNHIARINTNCSVTRHTDTITVCPGELPYTWNGNPYLAAGTYTTTLVTAAGCDSINTLILQVSSSNISGPTKVCTNVSTGEPAVYSIIAPAGSSFIWTVTQPASMTILSGAGTDHISVRFEPGFTNGAIYVRVSNAACGININRYISISQSAPGTPAGINASASSICPFIGTTNTVTYSIAKIPSATSYSWTVGSGTIVNHPNGTGINDTVITVRYLITFASSTITVKAVSDCGVSGIRTLSIRRDPPGLPGLISGSTNVCNNLLTPIISGGPYPSGIYTDYSVPFVPDVKYLWNLPTSYFTGNGSNYISAGFESTFSSGTITVRATNGCGASADRSLTVRTIAASAPGSITATNIGSCPARRYTYSIAALPPNADSILWNVPGGGIIESGQGTTFITVSYPVGTILGYVTAQGVNRCSISSTRKIHVNMPACAGFIVQGRNEANSAISKTNGTSFEGMQVNVFPNPSQADFSIQVFTAGKEQVRVSVMDVVGRKISTCQLAPYQTMSIGSTLKAGTYFIETRQGNQVKTTRVIKL